MQIAAYETTQGLERKMSIGVEASVIEGKINKRLTELYVKHNSAGKTYEELFETMKFDTFLTAEEAVENGFADKVVENR